MRWQQLFADLEVQFAALSAEELQAEVRDRSRRETALLRLADRLGGALGHPVSVAVSGGLTLAGTLVACGPDWVLLAESPVRETLVPLAAVRWLSGLGSRSAAPGSEGTVGARLGLAWALRGVARDRSAVALVLTGGGALTGGDAPVLTGTLDRVGVDWLELAEHPVGVSRRADEVVRVRTVPLAAVALVRRAV